MEEISAQDVLNGIAFEGLLREAEAHIQDNVILCLTLAEKMLCKRWEEEQWLRSIGVSDKEASALHESLKVFLR